MFSGMGKGKDTWEQIYTRTEWGCLTWDPGTCEGSKVCKTACIVPAFFGKGYCSDQAP